MIKCHHHIKALRKDLDGARYVQDKKLTTYAAILAAPPTVNCHAAVDRQPLATSGPCKGKTSTHQATLPAMAART